MATIKEILSVKGPRIVSVGPEATVQNAAAVMNEHRIGCLVVMADGRIVGMFSERDVLRRVVGERRDPVLTRVADVMTPEVTCCTPETSVDEARQAMKDRRIRHLPVVDGDSRLIGLVSIGDLNAFELNCREQTIYQMSEYLYGRV